MSVESPTPDLPLLGLGPAVLAFDVGGTDVKAAIFDVDGRVRAHVRTPTPAPQGGDAGALTRRLGEVAVDLRRRAPDLDPQAVGLVAPGIVDSERGTVVFASNLGWRDEPLAALTQKATGLPVAFEHDVRAASLAEHRWGGARQYDDLVMLVIGTGIAGAIVVDGRPHASGGYAGEIGHSPIADGPECPCGAKGCLETIASAGAIARRYSARSGRATRGAREVLDRVDAGDATAIAVWEEALDALALAIAQLSAVLAPQAIVVGGGLSRAGDRLFVPLREHVRSRLSFHRMPEIIPAALNDNAGIIGAAILARERCSTHTEGR